MKTSKEKTLAQIYKLMQQNGLTIADITQYAQKRTFSSKTPTNEFDLLYEETNGFRFRVPFSQKHSGKPIGIFPFKNEPEYIELDEVENKKHTDEDVDENRLLDEDFCKRVYKIKHHLNIYLSALHKPNLDGDYLADKSYMRGCGWIVSFNDKWGTLASDYYGGNQPAKLRYMGRFNS